MRLGILGGAFNPPHLGHLILAQEAFTQLRLDRVVFMPYGEPSHRVLEDDPGAEERLTMCEYAVGADARFAVSRMEIDRPGPVFTVDTLRELRAREDVSEVLLLLGGDQAAALGSWQSPEEVLSLASVAVAERDEWRRASIMDRLSGVSGAEHVVFFEMPRIEISSSMIRRRAREGQPIRYLVPDKVANYVGAQSLYGSSVPAGGAAVAAAAASGAAGAAGRAPSSGEAGAAGPAPSSGATRDAASVPGPASTPSGAPR